MPDSRNCCERCYHCERQPLTDTLHSSPASRNTRHDTRPGGDQPHGLLNEYFKILVMRYFGNIYTDIFSRSPAVRVAGPGEESHQVGGGGVET